MTKPIYCSIGNNDSFNGNYYVDPNVLFYTFLSNHLYKDNWYSCLQNNKNKNKFRKRFPKCGYYEIRLPKHHKNKLIVLNTTLLSASATTKDEDLKKAQDIEVRKQFKWLRNKLNHTYPTVP